MFSSAEIRWFKKGEVPASLRDWFYDLDGKPFIEPTRTDHYLRLPGSVAMGLKLRENRIEFKQRRGVQENLDLPGSLTGVIEYYQKWSFPVIETHAVDETLSIYGNSWIAIEKTRAMHRYRVGTNGISRHTQLAGMIDQGCGLELTTLDIAGQDDPWWTLGFEAFGNEDDLKSILLSVVNMVTELQGLPDLDADISCGYAEWLQKNYLSLE